MTITANTDQLADLDAPLKEGEAPGVSEETIDGLTEVFKQLSDKSRFKILLALAEHEELHVSALCEQLAQNQPAVSHHLTLLRKTGLVSYRRAGKHNYYRLKSALVSGLLEDFFGTVGEESGETRQLPLDQFALVFKKK